MTKLTVTEEIAERIRRSEGPIELGVAKQLMSGLGLIPMIEICDDGMYAGCTSREMDR